MCDIGLYLFCLLCNIKDSYMEYVTKRLKCFKYYITTSAVRALVISPRTWITPSIGAMGCKSIATIRGRSPSLHSEEKRKELSIVQASQQGKHELSVYIVGVLV